MTAPFFSFQSVDKSWKSFDWTVRLSGTSGTDGMADVEEMEEVPWIKSTQEAAYDHPFWRFETQSDMGQT